MRFGQDVFDQVISFSNIWERIKQTWITTEQGRKRVPEPHHRQHAWLKYRQTVKSFRDEARLLLALGRYQVSDRVKRGFVQDAGTWFGSWQEWEPSEPAKAVASADSEAQRRRDAYAFHSVSVAAFILEFGDPARSVSARDAFNDWAKAGGEGNIFSEGTCSPAHDFWDRWLELAAEVTA
jgi:hypothetical protein